MSFDPNCLHPELTSFLKKYVPSALECTTKKALLDELDDFITSTFDENDEPTSLSREGESVYDTIYCCY